MVRLRRRERSRSSSNEGSGLRIEEMKTGLRGLAFGMLRDERMIEAGAWPFEAAPGAVTPWLGVGREVP